VPSLPLADAAAALGVSVDTVRRRIRRGALEAAKDERGRYVVEVAEDAAPMALPSHGDAAEVAVLRERVTRLEAELEARRREAEAAEVAQREMRALVSQAQSLQLRLMGGGSSGSLAGGDATMTGTQPPRRRWWLRGGDNL
jgi:predicted site-specific integrase-resolvase